MRAIALCLVVACGGKKSADPPAAPAAPGPVVATTTTTAPGDWRDWDALPPGAIKRLGSQKLRTAAAVTAIRDDGTAAIGDEMGVLEVRSDGKYRLVLAAKCGEDDAFRYVSGELRGTCRNQQFAVHGGATTATTSPCEGKQALSPSGAYVACAVSGEKTEALMLVPWGGAPAWKVEIGEEPRRVLVSDAGDVIVMGEKTVSLARAGAVAWTKPIAFDWSGLGADGKHVVGWDSDKRAIVRLALADGAEQSRVATDYSVSRQIVELPDGASYFIMAYTGGGEELARVDARTGKIVARWPGYEYEWGNAVSASGAWGVSVGAQHFVRIDLAKGLVVGRTAAGDQPHTIAMSADRTTLAYASNGTDRAVIGLFDIATGAQRAMLPAPELAEAIEVSPDGARVAVASQFGPFTILDAHTGAPQCSATEIPGAKLYWYGDRIVAYYPGDNGDDCDEITEGSITVADDRCKVIAHHEIYGLVGVLESSPARTIAAFAKWKNECGAEYELVPYQAFSIDTRTGAKTRVPKLDGEQAKRDAARETESNNDYNQRALPVVSADGKTRASMESDDGPTSLVCRDVATKKELARFTLPNDVGVEIVLSRDGTLAALSDRSSVLLYPCRR